MTVRPAKAARPAKQKAPDRLEASDLSPPFDLDAERCVLCSLLIDGQLVDDVALMLRPDDFYDEGHRDVFGACLAVNAAGKRVDIHLVGDELIRMGALGNVGGASVLAEIAQIRPWAANVEHYAAIVREHAQRRHLLHVSWHGLTAARDLQTPLRDTLADLEAQMLAVAEREADEQRTRPLRDVLVDALAEYQARQEGRATGVLSGFAGLDELTGGFRRGEVAVVAGLSSMGKTALALNIALHAAVEADTPTLVISLEMTATDLAGRLASIHSGVSAKSIETNSASAEQRQGFLESCNELSIAPLIIDDRPSRNVTEIAAVARRVKRRHGLGLLVIDYLQLIAADNPRDSRNEQVAAISRRIKAMARDLAVPVLLLAQLNREPAKGGEDAKPRLHHLRDSGAIEQDADLVMFVHRPSYFRTEFVSPTAADPCELLVAKHRNGPTGTVPLEWFRGCQRFSNAN